MSVKCVVCSVTHNAQTNKILLYPGISSDELVSLIQSLFALDCTVLGLRGSDGLVVPLTLACASPEILPSHCSLVLPVTANLSTSMALVPFPARQHRATSPPPQVSINTSIDLSPRDGSLKLDDSLDQILRFITGLRTRKLITRSEAVSLEEHLFEEKLLLRAAYAVAFDAGDSEYFSEICHDLAENLKTKKGLAMCQAQEDLLEVCRALEEDGNISTSQSLRLKHLILIRDQSISTIYNNFQKHKSYDVMGDEIFSYITAHFENDNKYEDEESGVDTSAATASHLSPSLAYAPDTIQGVLDEMLTSGDLNTAEAAELRSMVAAENEYVQAAFEIYESDRDIEELTDTLTRCVKLSLRKKSMSTHEATVSHRLPMGDSNDDDDDDNEDEDDGYEEDNEDVNAEDDDEEDEDPLSNEDLSGVDLSALLTSLGVSQSWSNDVPNDFIIAVFAFAHTKTLSTNQAKALCDLYASEYDLVRAAWEVYRVQNDLHDFIDTLIRIIREVNLDNLEAGFVGEMQKNVQAGKVNNNDEEIDAVDGNNEEEEEDGEDNDDEDSPEADSAVNPEPQESLAARRDALAQETSAAHAAIAVAKQDLLKHSLEMMVKQGMLSAEEAAGLVERSVEGEVFIEAAIEAYARDRNIQEFLKILQVLAQHSRAEIEGLMRSGRETEDTTSGSNPNPSTAPVPNMSSSEANIMNTLRAVISQLTQDSFLSQENADILVDLVDSGDKQIFGIFQRFSVSKDWVELLQELGTLAAAASEALAHTPENPAYDYVDDDDDDDDNVSEEDGEYVDDNEEELDPLDDLPTPPTAANERNVPPPVTVRVEDNKRASYSYSSKDLKEVLGVLYSANAIGLESLRHLESLADANDPRINDVFSSYRENKDVYQLLENVQKIIAEYVENSTHGQISSVDANEGSVDGVDVEGNFLRVVESMQLSSLETAALRLAIARNDQTIKDALDAYRNTQDDEALKITLRKAAAITIEETLDEAPYSIGSPEKLMSSAAAREHVFPMLVSELVKEKIMEEESGSKLVSLFNAKSPDISSALDTYDLKNDMAELVVTLQRISQ